MYFNSNYDVDSSLEALLKGSSQTCTYVRTEKHFEVLSGVIG